MDPVWLVFRIHAIRRMAERAISVEEVRLVLESGEIIESYAEDWPHPSNLILGRPGGRPLHVVAAQDREGSRTIIVTVYEPDEAQWDATFKRRLKL